MDRTFSWDAWKAAGNFRKHGISFEEASSAFTDPFCHTFHDLEHSIAEERLLLIGRSDKGHLLIVAHVERGDDDYRLISARLAARRERIMYEEGD